MREFRVDASISSSTPDWHLTVTGLAHNKSIVEAQECSSGLYHTYIHIKTFDPYMTVISYKRSPSFLNAWTTHELPMKSQVKDF